MASWRSWIEGRTAPANASPELESQNWEPVTPKAYVLRHGPQTAQRHCEFIVKHDLLGCLFGILLTQGLLRLSA